MPSSGALLNKWFHEGDNPVKGLFQSAEAKKSRHEAGINMSQFACYGMDRAI